MNQQEPTSNQSDTGPLLRITANYLTSVGHRPSEAQLGELRQRLETLPPKQVDQLKTRLAIYALLDGQTGRDLREAAERSSTLIGEQLRQQQRHVREVLALLIQPDEDPAQALAKLNSDVQGEPTEFAADPELLYQQTLYGGDAQAEAGRLLGKPGADKWIKLVPLAFKDENIVTLLDGLGFVPEQLYANKKFAETVSFQDLTHCHNLLRTHPHGGHARAQLLRHLFLSGINTQAGGSVSIDTNGLWINLERRQKGAAHRLHAHIPYPYATPELLEAMYMHECLTAEDVTEAKLRRAEADNDIDAIALFEERQARQVMESAWRALNAQKGGLIEKEISQLRPIYEHLKTLRPPELYDELLKSTFSQRTSEDPHAPFSHALLASGVMRHYLRRPTQSDEIETNALSERVGRLLRDAAKLQPAKLKQSDRSVYDAARIAGILLDHQPSIEHLVRIVTNSGKYSFLALANDPNIRIALNPEKGLTKPQREVFAQLPAVEEK